MRVAGGPPFKVFLDVTINGGATPRSTPSRCSVAQGRLFAVFKGGEPLTLTAQNFLACHLAAPIAAIPTLRKVREGRGTQHVGRFKGQASRPGLGEGTREAFRHKQQIRNVPGGIEPDPLSGIYARRLPIVWYRTKLRKSATLKVFGSPGFVRMPHRSQHGNEPENTPEDVGIPLSPPKDATNVAIADRVKQLKQELNRLMEEHLESRKRETFVPADIQQHAADVKRLKAIREASADFLAAMTLLYKKTEEESMSEKPCVTLPGKVEKVIEPIADEPEKAQITIEGADPLYSVLRTL